MPLAEHGSAMFFVIEDLLKINGMYQFSLSSFLKLFQRALESTKVGFLKTSKYCNAYIVAFEIDKRPRNCLERDCLLRHAFSLE